MFPIPKFCRLLLAALLLLLPEAFHAAPRVVPIPSTSHGAANKNWAVDEDERGFVYFGNDQGLLEFDGVQWRLHELPHASVIRSVAVESHTTLYTGGYEEFGRWDRQASGDLLYTSLVPDEPNAQPQNSDFWKIYITPRGVLFQSFSELYLYDGESVQRIDPHRNLLFLLRCGPEMWAQEMGGGLYRFDGKNFTPIPGSNHFASTTVRVLLETPVPGQYLIGTGTQGVEVYDGKNFHTWNPRLSQLLQDDELNCATRTSRNTYLFGTIRGGVIETDERGNVIQQLTSDNLLTDNTVMALHEDSAHNVWLLTDRGPTYLIYRDDTDYHLMPDWVYGSVYDATLWNGRLIIGTNQGAYCIDHPQFGNPRLLEHIHPIAGTEGQVWSFSVIDGRLWCSHNTGLLEIKPDLSVHKASGMGGYLLKKVRINDHDELLYASYYKLRRLDPVRNMLVELDSLNESIYRIEVDHLQNLWLEHPVKGVYRCRLEDSKRLLSNIHYYGGDQDPTLPYALQVFRIGGRAVLVGNDRFYAYNDLHDQLEPDSLLLRCFAGKSDLRRIVPIDRSRYWAITGKGVYLLTYDGYNASLTPYPDIPVRRLVYGYEHVAVLNDSTSLFCCDNGFILQHIPARDSASFTPAAPSIEMLGAGMNRPEQHYFKADQTPQISYRDHSIGIRFAVRDALARQLSFRYRMRGVDGGWITGNTTGEVLYERLPRGHYTFEVQAEDPLGNRSEATQVHFEILSPWYATGWAYAGYVVLIMLLVAGTWLLLLQRYRRSYLRKLRHEEILTLRSANQKLREELEIRDAEIFSQSSMLVAKNEVIDKIREMIGDFNQKLNNKSLTPLIYRINTFIDSHLNTEKDWRLFLIRFEQKHSGFFRVLKERYPELTGNDLRLCACLRLRLDSKEIASLMNLTVRAVENSRYRLRKKLDLKPSQNLSDFLMEIDPETDSTWDEERKSIQNTTD